MTSNEPLADFEHPQVRQTALRLTTGETGPVPVARPALPRLTSQGT